MHFHTIALGALLAGAASARQHARRQAYGSGYTTYTTLCESTVNGTVVVATHTHSKHLTPSGYSPPIGTSAGVSTSPSSPGSVVSGASSNASPSRGSGPASSLPTSYVVPPNTHGATTYTPSNTPSLPTYSNEPGSGYAPSLTASAPYSSIAYSYGPSHTTYTTLCESTVNGTVVVATHTHSKVIPPSGYGLSLTASGIGSLPTNATCSGQTLNVLGASLDWWYTHTYTYAASTFDIQYDSHGRSTGWTLLPATTTFDVAAAVLQPTCTSKLVYYPQYSTSLYSVSCFETPAPTAAATSVLTQTAYKSFTQTTGTGSLPSVAVTPPPPSATIPSSGGTYSAGTPFVFFSAYEIMTKYPTVYRNGSKACAEATQIYTMKAPFSFEYEGEDVDGQKVVNAGVTGDVNPAFLGIVNVTAAVAGSWVAAPTVVVIMEKVLGAQAILAPETATEISASALATPTPTLPAGIIPLKSTTAGVVIPTDLTAHVESTAASLGVPNFGGQPTTTAEEDSTTKEEQVRTTLKPFTAHLESTVIILEISVPETQTVVTAVYSGGTVTAVAVSDVQTGATTPTGLGALIGAIIGVATQPTNALEVLSKALTTYAPGATGIALGQGSPGASQIPLITLGTSVYTANAATQYSVGPGAILTPGGKIVVDGSTIELSPGATALVVNGVTTALSPPSITPAPALTVESTAYVGNEAPAFEVASQMLTPGGVMIVSGTTFSLASDGGAMVVNGATHSVSVVASDVDAAKATITAPPILTIDGTAYGPNGGSSYIIDGQTLTPGGTVTLVGPMGVVTVSLNSAANTAYTILDSGSTTFTSPIGSPATMAPVLTIDGNTFTAANPAIAAYIVNGKTLVPGGPEQTITISGSTFIVSLEPQATVLVIEEPNAAGAITSTIFETLFPGAASAARSTVYITASGTATTSASDTTGGAATATPSAGLQNAASPMFFAGQIYGLMAVGLTSLALAIWL